MVGATGGAAGTTGYTERSGSGTATAYGGTGGTGGAVGQAGGPGSSGSYTGTGGYGGNYLAGGAGIAAGAYVDGNSYVTWVATQTAQLESKHAKDTIYNADRLAALKTGIAVDVRSELERAHRLQLSADSRAATYRAQAEADATARRNLADKASALDASLAEGRVVATELGGALKQRDAEVAALCNQVIIERGLSGDVGDQACRGS